MDQGVVEIVRVTLHVLAATVWVGGQLVLAGLVPALRAASPEAPRAAARAFRRVAWPAFGVLVVTGLWNALAEWDETTGGERTVLYVKGAIVLLSGGFAYEHEQARTRGQLAAFGALSALTAVAALVLGVVLRG